MDISQDFDFSHLEDVSEIEMPELKAIVAWLSAENFFFQTLLKCPNVF